MVTANGNDGPLSSDSVRCYYTLPGIRNYVRNDQHQVYCLDTHTTIGRWDPVLREIVIEGDYYHGPPVVPCHEETSRPIWLEEDRRSTLAAVPDFSTNDLPMSVSELNVGEDAAEEYDRYIYPVEGAPDFFYSSQGRIYYSPEGEPDLRVTCVGYQQETTYLGVTYRRKTTQIKLFPRYRRLVSRLPLTMVLQ